MKWPEQVGYVLHYTKRLGSVTVIRPHPHSEWEGMGAGGLGPQVTSLMGFPHYTEVQGNCLAHSEHSVPNLEYTNGFVSECELMCLRGKHC